MRSAGSRLAASADPKPDAIGLLVSAAVVSLRAGWARIAVRVAGSWVAAVGILMFGWMLQ